MRDLPVRYGASFRSTATLAANTPETVFSSAVNVRGAVVHVADFQEANASAAPSPAFLAKTSAPASVTDGDSIASQRGEFVIAGGFSAWGGSYKEIFVPAGKGLYYISNVASTRCNRGVLYSLL